MQTTTPIAAGREFDAAKPEPVSANQINAETTTTTLKSLALGMIKTRLPVLVDRYLRPAAHFTAADSGAPPHALAAVELKPDEAIIGWWRAPRLSKDMAIQLTTLGVRGHSDGKLTFVPYTEISELRVPDPNDPGDARMHELMLYTRAEECVFFPLYDSQRDHRAAAVLFKFLSSVVAVHAQAVFMGQWDNQGQ